MKRVAVAVVEKQTKQSSLFTQYLEDNGIGVLPCGPDKVVGGARELREADLVLARSASDETEIFRASASACRQNGKPLMAVALDGSDAERTMLLRMGADDALTPPYSMEEVVLRIQALARRSGAPAAAERWTWMLGTDELTLDDEKHVALLNGTPLKLTEAQWGILRFLGAHGDAAVSRQQLMERCLSYSDNVYDRAVDTHIKNLRAKLGSPDWIGTVRGYGYRFSWSAKKL
jgi:DNA-binding response OmpR family regulator